MFTVLGGYLLLTLFWLSVPTKIGNSRSCPYFEYILSPSMSAEGSRRYDPYIVHFQPGIFMCHFRVKSRSRMNFASEFLIRLKINLNLLKQSLSIMFIFNSQTSKTNCQIMEETFFEHMYFAVYVFNHHEIQFISILSLTL